MTETQKAWRDGKIIKGWQDDREFFDKQKIAETKAACQRLQIEYDLDNKHDALIMFLVRKGVI